MASRKHGLWSFLLLLLPGLCDADLPSLMTRLAAMPHPPRHFAEQRQSELLRDPVTLQGTLSYQDGRLVKAIHSPFSQRFTIEGERLLIDQGDGTPVQQLTLSDHPALLTFVTIFRATLQGDLKTLQDHYLTELTEDGDKWQLTLRPRSAEVAVHLRLVTITGDVQGIRRFHIEEQSGDESMMELGEALP